MPTFSKCHLGLGNAYKKLGNINEAKKEYEETLNCWSNNFLGLVSLAHIEMLSHNSNEAKKKLKDALKTISNSQL